MVVLQYTLILSSLHNYIINIIIHNYSFTPFFHQAAVLNIISNIYTFYTFETTREKLIFQIVMFYFQHFKQIRVLLLTIFNEELRITTKKLWLLFSMLILTGIGRNLQSHVEWFTGMAYVGLLIGSGGTTQFNVFHL